MDVYGDEDDEKCEKAGYADAPLRRHSSSSKWVARSSKGTVETRTIEIPKQIMRLIILRPNPTQRIV